MWDRKKLCSVTSTSQRSWKFNCSNTNGWESNVKFISPGLPHWWTFSDSAIHTAAIGLHCWGVWRDRVCSLSRTKGWPCCNQSASPSGTAQCRWPQRAFEKPGTGSCGRAFWKRSLPLTSSHVKGFTCVCCPCPVAVPKSFVKPLTVFSYVTLLWWGPQTVLCQKKTFHSQMCCCLSVSQTTRITTWNLLTIYTLQKPLWLILSPSHRLLRN